MRLIDADEAVKAVHDEFDECLVWDESGEATANEFENIILQMPTVDPVKHGQWKRTDAYPHKVYCSECYATLVPNDEWLELYKLSSNYCPNCGAKMDEAKDGKI